MQAADQATGELSAQARFMVGEVLYARKDYAPAIREFRKVLFGFNSISMAIVSAMAAEIVPQRQMGRWIGIVSLVRGLASIPAPLIGGLIWDHVGPNYVFLATIAIDALVRLPLLASIRETLHLKVEPDEPSRRTSIP